ncbi:dephospho-CoA kinase [Bradyrhizobium sp. CIR18]|uniref:AAA family ATPase n=1 Tax=Bradyrhizobium sp. CIR18 TaxID=2663839 RepID=UPI001606D5C6|nr:AAA family ATPase [Bradyrhizobium sp. CIR18]MBB4360622.1 dephospho-CoA kinase [Bradyrhizobium sp. CIR18]
MSLLLCFSGQIGSGKSSVSKAVAAALGCRRTGFGDYLRSEIARLGGDPNDRKALQDLGQKRVEDDSAAFCRDVLAAGGFQAGEDFVIDGIRHVAIFERLAAVGNPSDVRLLYLVASETTRNVRVQSRDDAQDFVRASTHHVETELQDALPQRADAVIDANQPFDRVVADCLDLVRGWQ